MSVKKIINEEIKSLFEDYYDDRGIVRLYHRIGSHQTENLEELIASVLQNGLLPFDNKEVGNAIWFSNNFDDYAKNGKFVVALDFDTSSNGAANNSYEMVYNGQNAYAYKPIPFNDLIVIKIPVMIMPNHGIWSNDETIRLINEGTITPDIINSENYNLIIFQNIFNKYVQPKITIPDFVQQLNPEKITLKNIGNITEDVLNELEINLKELIKENHNNNPIKEEYMNLNDITLWHGSTKKFDQFDISMVGTGDNSSLGGWGIYFSDNKAVSMRYFLPKGQIRQYRLRSGEYFDLDNSVEEGETQRMLIALQRLKISNKNLQEFEENYVHTDYPPTNKNLYDWLSYELKSEKNASMFLNKLGYIGNTMEDRWERNARNYVVFDLDAILNEVEPPEEYGNEYGDENNGGNYSNNTSDQ